jgi:hypothetical protein
MLKKTIKMKSGLIYPIIKITLEKVKYLNLVEFFKFIARKFNSNNNSQDKIDELNRFGTDIFIIIKWLFLFLIWDFNINNSVITFLVWYLIIANVYTYFYYHIWSDNALKTDDFTKDRIRRRFMNLILALTYSVFCFAYLFQIPYCDDIDWGLKTSASLYSIMFSFSNSLASNYSDIKPLTDTGNVICNIQLLITFFFATIILSRSIPQTNSSI